MESIARQSVNLCPFVKRAASSLGSVKSLQQTNMPAMASRCPFMGHAMQKAQLATSAATGAQATASRTVGEQQSSVMADHATQESKFDYDGLFEHEVQKKRADKSYRFFNNINRLAKEFPMAHRQLEEDKVTVWCSNDYLALSKNQQVVDVMKRTLDKYGAGAGGTRNIAGHNQHALRPVSYTHLNEANQI